MGIDVGFIIETDNNANQYVHVFYLDLKTDDYGLNESIKKKSIILTEIELRKSYPNQLGRFYTIKPQEFTYGFSYISFTTDKGMIPNNNNNNNFSIYSKYINLF